MQHTLIHGIRGSQTVESNGYWSVTLTPALENTYAYLADLTFADLIELPLSTPLLAVADLNDTTVDHVTFDTPDHYITIGEFFDKARETIAIIFAEKDYHEMFNTEQQFSVNTLIDFTEHLWEMTKSNFINKNAFIPTDDLINDVFECLTDVRTRNVYRELIKPEYL